METESLKTFSMDKEGNSTDRYLNALKDPVVRGALDKWIGLNMVRGGDAVVMVSPDDPGVAKILHGLPDEKRQNVVDLMNKVVGSNTMKQAQRREKMQAEAVVNGAGIISPIMGLKADQNLKLSETIMNAIRKPGDVDAQKYGQIAEQKIAQRDPSGQKQIELLGFQKGEAAKLQNEQHDVANPARVTVSSMASGM
jgi:hypothetical protein